MQLVLVFCLSMKENVSLPKSQEVITPGWVCQALISSRIRLIKVAYIDQAGLKLSAQPQKGPVACDVQNAGIIIDTYKLDGLSSAR